MDDHESQTDADGYLDGKLLIAMPGLEGSYFARSVIFMCAHSEAGAMGIVVNKPAPELDFSDLLEQLNIPANAEADAIEVHLGGPVEHGRGFVLHSSEYEIEDSTLHVGSEFCMTATLDILRDIAKGSGPEKRLLALGYAGWGPGQLEKELQENGWLVCDAEREVVFEKTDDAKWEAALSSMGVSAGLLSGAGGLA